MSLKTQTAVVTRQRLLKRRELNIALEEKTGIRKSLEYLAETGNPNLIAGLNDESKIVGSDLDKTNPKTQN
jgi:hypothetical protein